MTREEAIEYFFKFQPTYSDHVRRLTVWNPEYSIKENGRAIGWDSVQTKAFASRYKLSFTKSQAGRSSGGVARMRHALKDKGTKILKENGFTDEDIDIMFKHKVHKEGVVPDYKKETSSRPRNRSEPSGMCGL